MMRMIRKTLVLAVMFAATAAFGQEFGRASGGELSLFTKQPSRISGSFSVFGGSQKGFLGSAGGTLIPDKAWFFVSGQEAKFTSVDTKHLLDGLVFKPNASSTFMNAHYTNMISPNAFFDIHITTSKTH